MAKQKQNFEDALKRLEDIVARMEAGEMQLEQSLALFEEGVGLVRFCTAKLDEAKKKVEVLVSKQGTLTREPFNPEQESDRDSEE